MKDIAIGIKYHYQFSKQQTLNISLNIKLSNLKQNRMKNIAIIMGGYSRI
jgi:hypothetical protein